MRLLGSALALLALTVSAGMPAGAATASCGGLSPLVVECSTSFTPGSDHIQVTVDVDPTFVGLIEISFTDGDRSTGFPCVQLSIAGQCEGAVQGLFGPDDLVTMSAEVFTVNRITSLPVENVTPSIGTWTVTATS